MRSLAKYVAKKKAATPKPPKHDRIRLIESVIEAAEVVRENRNREKEINASTKEVQAGILAAMEELKMDRLVKEDKELTVLVVKPTSVSIDIESLLKDIEAKYPEVLAKVTRTALDMEALTRAVNSGEIDAALVTKHSSEQKREPYVRVS